MYTIRVVAIETSNVCTDYTMITVFKHSNLFLIGNFTSK